MNFLLENSRKIAFILFLLSALLAVLIYTFPRYEYDAQASEVTIAFEDGYNAEISPFYSIRDIDATGLAGERVISVLDFDRLKGDLSFYEALLKDRNGEKVIFIGNPPDIPPKDFAGLLDESRIAVGFLELNQVTEWMRNCLQNMSEEIRQKLFRVHTVKPAELDTLKLTYPMVIRRWMRAAQERSIDLFWVQPFDESFVSYEVYGTELSRTVGFAEELTTQVPDQNMAFKIIFITGCFAIIYFYSPLFFVISAAIFVFSIYSTSMSDAYLQLAGLSAAFGVAGLYRWIRHITESPMMKYVSLLLITLVLGNLINALSFSFDAVNQIYLPHNVKLTLFFLPFLVFLKEFAEYGFKDLTKRLHWTDLLFILFIILFGIYYIIRSGNSAWVMTSERQLRDSIEGIFQIRPRFKEIIGIPCLWLYFSGVHRKFGRYSFMIPVLGTVGLCSIVNSFQHVHSPIQTVIFREILGIFIGSVLGVLIWLIVRYRDNDVSKQI
ncbi:MAG TPA: DUF5693 family protein [Thermotogota bacterium]|nr:DUF5693 family protein [Thermotogota bacterium]HPJ89059.1 DUF5693 family protein [Thermotogota bacterium]